MLLIKINGLLRVGVLCAFLTISFSAVATAQYDCRTAQTLREILDEQHIEPEALQGKWSKAVKENLILSLDHDGLIFTQADFQGELQDFDQLGKVFETDACNAINKLTDFLKKRISILDSILGSYEENQIRLALKGATDIHDITDLPENFSEQELRWRQFLSLSFFKVKHLEGGGLLDSTRGDSEIWSEVLTRERCKLSKKLQKLNDEEFTSKVVFNAIARAYDPHTRYYPYSLLDLIEQIIEDDEKSFGFDLSENEKGEIAINKLIPGGPAWRSNQIYDGDVLIKVKGKDGSFFNFDCVGLDAAKNALSRNGDENVELTFRSKSKQIKTVVLSKEKKTDENAVRAYVLNGEKKVGYISLPGFYTIEGDEKEDRGCARDVAREIIKLGRENIDGLIVDLRNNGGGSLREALELLGIFIEEGPLVLMEKDEKVRVIRDQNRGAIYFGPLVVLVNGQSASASELVASTLKDYNRALIVGDTTFGKAVGQEMKPIGSIFKKKNPQSESDKLESAILKVSTSRLYRLKGDSYQGLGVVPHLYVPDIFETVGRKESSNPYSIGRRQIERDTYFKKYPEFPLTDLTVGHENRLSVSGFYKLKTVSDLLISNRLDLSSVLSDESLIQIKSLQMERARLIKSIQKAKNQLFKADNHEFDKSILSIDAKKKKVEMMTFKDLENNIYIQAAYEIMVDLIESTK